MTRSSRQKIETNPDSDDPPSVAWGDLMAVERDILKTVGRLHSEHDHTNGKDVVDAIHPAWKGMRIYTVLDRLDEWELIDKRIRVPDGAHNSYVLLPRGARLLEEQEQDFAEIVAGLPAELRTPDDSTTGARAGP